MSFQLVLYLSLIHVTSLLLHSLALWLLLNRIHPGSPFFSVYVALTASLAVGYFLPGRLGFPARVYLYHRIFNISTAVSFGLLGWELIVTTVIPLIFSIPALWIFSSDPLFFAAVLFLILMLLLFAAAVYGLWRYGDGIHGLSKIRRLISPLSPLGEGLIQTVKPLDFLMLAAFSFLCLLVLTCSAWFSRVFLMSLGSPVPFLTLLSIQSLSYLAGFISLMPMGLGARELSLAVLLGEAGVRVDVATYAAVIQRVLATGISFLLGLISMQILWLKGSLRQIPQSQEVHSIREP